MIFKRLAGVSPSTAIPSPFPLSLVAHQVERRTRKQTEQKAAPVRNLTAAFGQPEPIERDEVQTVNDILPLDGIFLEPQKKKIPEEILRDVESLCKKFTPEVIGKFIALTYRENLCKDISTDFEIPWNYLSREPQLFQLVMKLNEKKYILPKSSKELPLNFFGSTSKLIKLLSIFPEILPPWFSTLCQKNRALMKLDAAQCKLNLERQKLERSILSLHKRFVDPVNSQDL